MDGHKFVNVLSKHISVCDRFQSARHVRFLSHEFCIKHGRDLYLLGVNALVFIRTSNILPRLIVLRLFLNSGKYEARCSYTIVLIKTRTFTPSKYKMCVALSLP